MQGRILNYDPNRNTGTISAENGKRYKFTGSEFRAAAHLLTAGTQVDFDIDDTGSVALDIYTALPADSGEKNKIVAALLAFFLGGLGVHKFYLGRTSAGIIMLLCGTIGLLLIIPALVIYLIAFIEFIIYLVKSDQEFHEQYVIGDKAWF